MDSESRSSIEKLLFLSVEAYSKPLLPHVSDDPSEVLCGWRLAKPRPEYRIQARKKHRRQAAGVGAGGSTSHLPSTTHLIQNRTKVMRGKLDSDCNYVYDIEVSAHSKMGPALRGPPLAHCIVLNPVIVDRSESLSESARTDIERLAKMQLKPDIAHEQMIIDEKLKSLDFNCKTNLQMHFQRRPPPTHQPVPVKDPFNDHFYRHCKKRTRRKSKGNSKTRAKNFDWSLLRTNAPSFRNDSKPALRSSFSRLLESSSVMFSYKK